MPAIFQISLSCCFIEGMLPGIRTHERKRKKENIRSSSAFYHQLCPPLRLNSFFPDPVAYFLCNSQRGRKKRCVLSWAASKLFSVLVSSWLLYRFEILDGKSNCVNKLSQNFLEVAYLSSLCRWGWRRGGRSPHCVFIHSNQESVEQERRLGSRGTLSH